MPAIHQGSQTNKQTNKKPYKSLSKRWHISYLKDSTVKYIWYPAHLCSPILSTPRSSGCTSSFGRPISPCPSHSVYARSCLPHEPVQHYRIGSDIERSIELYYVVRNDEHQVELEAFLLVERLWPMRGERSGFDADDRMLDIDSVSGKNQVSIRLPGWKTYTLSLQFHLAWTTRKVIVWTILIIASRPRLSDAVMSSIERLRGRDATCS